MTISSVDMPPHASESSRDTQDDLVVAQVLAEYRVAGDLGVGVRVGRDADQPGQRISQRRPIVFITVERIVRRAGGDAASLEP